jgi:hypothetical protein
VYGELTPHDSPSYFGSCSLWLPTPPSEPAPPSGPWPFESRGNVPGAIGINSNPTSMRSTEPPNDGSDAVDGLALAPTAYPMVAVIRGVSAEHRVHAARGSLESPCATRS